MGVLYVDVERGGAGPPSSLPPRFTQPPSKFVGARVYVLTDKPR